MCVSGAGVNIGNTIITLPPPQSVASPFSANWPSTYTPKPSPKQLPKSMSAPTRERGGDLNPRGNGAERVGVRCA